MNRNMGKGVYLFLAAALLCALVLVISPSVSLAQPPRPSTAGVEDNRPAPGALPAFAPESITPDRVAATLTVDGACTDADLDLICDAPATDTYKTIQKAIDMATAGDTINVLAGTYIENVIVTKSLTLTGAGAATTTVWPATSGPRCTSGSGSICTGGVNLVAVRANDVVITGFTFDGDNPALTSGVVRNGADLDARNGIVTDHSAVSLVTGLEIHHVTVRNIYLRGVYASTTAGTFNFHDNVVENVDGEYASIGIFNFGGSGTIADNTVTLANDAIAANHSRGTQFLRNTVTHSGSGVHSDNNGSGGGAADLLQGNTVTDCATNGYGVWTFASYLATTVNRNTITGCSVGLSVWGQFGTSAQQFTDNVVNGAAGTTGVYITTDLISYGYTDVSVSFSGNVIAGNTDGIYFTADNQSWNPEPYVAKTITAVFSDNSVINNATQLSVDSDDTDGTYNINASGNWWGDADIADVKTAVNGGVLVDYTPWLAVGTDTSADPGFQGDFSTLWVDDDSHQTGTTGRIQEGVNLVSGSTVNVAAGLYVEDVSVTKSVTLLGPKSGVPRNTGSATDWTSSTTASWTATEATAAGEAVIRSAAVVTDAVLDIAEDCNVMVKGFVIEARNRTDSTNAHLIYADGKNSGIQTIIVENNVIGPITGASQDGNKGRFGLAFDSQSSGGNNGLAGSVKGNKILGAEGNGANVFIIGQHYNPSMSDYSRMVIENNDVYGANRAGLELAGGIRGLTVRNNTVIYNGLIWNGADYVKSARSAADPNNILFGAGVNLIRTGTICGTSPDTQNAIENLVLGGNTIAFNEKSGVYVDAQQRNLMISANAITDNGRDGIWLDEFGTYNESKAYNEAYGYIQNATISNNTITGAAAPYAAIRVTGKPTTLAITENNLSGNNAGVVQEDGVGESWDYTADASANWWGDATPAGVAAKVGADVDYTPWLAAGADTGDPGFQGDFSTLWVDDNSPQTGTTGRIQEGINLVSGSTLYIANGLYKESNLLVDKTMTIDGESRSGVVIAPAAEDANVDNAFGSSAQNGFIIKAHGVTITKLTLDGRGNPGLTPGKNNFRAGIVTADASYPGGGGGAWNNLHVDGVTIQHPYRRGISVFPRSVSGTVIENSRVDDVAYNHAMYVGGQSQVLNNTVNHAFQGIVVDPDATTPAGLVKVNGNTLTDIGNFVGCWGYPNGQPRAIQPNPTGPARAFEVKNNTISDNGLEQYAGVVGIYTRLANSDSVIEGNNITLSSGVSWAEPGSQAVGMLLGWSYDNGFMVRNNEVNSIKYGIGVMIFGNGTAAHPLTLEGNTITSSSSAALDTGDGTGIYIANQYLFASDKNPSYVILQNGNTISGFVTGIAVENIPTSTYPLTLIAHNNRIAGNTTYGLNNTTGTTIDAELNWWGSACGPSGEGPGSGDAVSINIDYSPWWADAAMTTQGPIAGATPVIPTGATTAQAQAILDCAGPGSTVTFAGGSYPGGLFVNNSTLTLKLNSSTVGAPGPAFTIVGDNETIQGPGKIDGGGGGGAGILVQGGANNFMLKDAEVLGWADGVEVAGSVASLKIVGNWIHDNADAGLQVDSGAAIDGVVNIYGNLFKANGGNGLQNDGSTSPLKAEYNSWGHIDGPEIGDGGDGISGAVDAVPYTYVELFLDMKPETQALERCVVQNEGFDVALKADARKVYGLTFKISFDAARLTLNSTVFASPWVGRCTLMTGLGSGEIGYYCSQQALGGVEWDASGATLATLSFTALPVVTSPTSTLLNVAHLTESTRAAAISGVKVYVNNAGYGAPSVSSRDIKDADDGRVVIGVQANYTGYVDLEGRETDAGAVLQVYDQPSTATSVEYATGTSAASGQYTTAHLAGQSLFIGETYWFQVDRALYLPTTATATSPLYPVLPSEWGHQKLLSTAPTTPLALFVLLGGDATDDNVIDSGDAGCIGFDYDGPADICVTPTSSSDVNGDGTVDLLDLTLMGGNYYKTSSGPWVP